MGTIKYLQFSIAVLGVFLGFHQIGTLRAQTSNDIVLQDVFGRVISERGVILTDWDGHIANPVTKIFVKPPANTRYPGTAVLSSNEPRLYFDLPSSVGPNGPQKTIAFADDSPMVPVNISIFPDRDTTDEDHPLTVQYTDADGLESSATFNVHIIDQDRNLSRPFVITLDFSKDQTGFFNDPQKRDIIRQAADDWAYFIDDMDLDTVPVGSENTFIWNPDGFLSGTLATNSNAYKGFLLYVYGIHHAELRSGGEGSQSGDFQSSGGIQLPLRRSGGVEVETQGNLNTLNWFLTTSDSDWWKASNFGNEQNDLYSIVHHEIGHAIFFNSAYPLFEESKAKGFLESPALLAYHGSNPGIDSSEHFNGEIDNASKKGAFGYEYFGDVPRRRWLITKLDLLSAQAIGYRIRQTFALSILNHSLPIGVALTPYSHTLQATGGLPPYSWEIESGILANGLVLDPETGAISGTPSEMGTFDFTVRLRDSSEEGTDTSVPLSITITSGQGGPLISTAAFNGKKKLTIEGNNFGTVPRVLINNIDQTERITSSSETVIKIKARAKKLGLKPGDNTVQVIDATGAISNVFMLVL